MSPRKVSRRGTTLIEVLVAIALLLIIFLFITSDLIQASQAENQSATRTESVEAANYLMGVMRTDGQFWSGPGGNDWASPPLGNDPCGNPYPPYTDDINAPTWHPAPACTPSGNTPGIFPDMVGSNQTFQYMWNAQHQGGDPNAAQLTVWVQVDEGGRTNVYELNSTRGNIFAQPSPTGTLPTPTPKPKPSSSQPASPPSSPSPPGSPSAKPSPTPKGSGTPSPTPTPTHTATPPPTATPTPQPSGTFE
jgi:prepilin-type N-terminal cleavage/methylation domain-containing protein